MPGTNGIALTPGSDAQRPVKACEQRTQQTTVSSLVAAAPTSDGQCAQLAQPVQPAQPAQRDPLLLLTVPAKRPGLSPQRLHDQANHGGSSSGLPPAGSCGLGLFIARRVMALHGGRLQLRHHAARRRRASPAARTGGRQPMRCATTTTAPRLDT